MMSKQQAKSQDNKIQDVPTRDHIDPVTGEPSIESLRPYINQLNHYFKNTRRSQMPSRA
jgi:hypothetical protein